MSPSLPALDLDVELPPGSPPVLRVPFPDDPATWAADHRDALRRVVSGNGSLLVRGLGLRDAAQVGAVLGRLTNLPTVDTEPFAPRSVHGAGIHSSTPWPANQPMCMHHEGSYTLAPPGLLLFACLTAPTAGGATGVADATEVLDALPPDLVARFESTGWLLTRTFNDDIGASVAEAFDTDDRSAVEAYCRAHGIEFRWTDDGGLQTRQRRAAVVRHPATGQRCWFNQVAFLSEWTLAPEIREYLVDVYGADGLPFNTAFGDGTPIDQDVVDEINRVYEERTAREPWQPGDLLLVDNIRTAHSREAYEGPREVLVGMAEPVRLDVSTDGSGAR